MMQNAFDQFRANIERVRNLGVIHSAVKNTTTSILDLSDILRAEFVLAVSALDSYVHNIVEIGMMEIYGGSRSMTKRFPEFSISLQNLQFATRNPTSLGWLQDEIRERHSFQSFQKAEKIESVMKLISDKDLWKEISNIMSKPKDDVKLQLNLIVERRNKIAHEADMDPTYPNKRWDIDEKMTNESISFISDLGKAIFKIL